MNPKKIIPILSWLPQYKKRYFKGDVSAGITVGVMLIPQGMAYAAIAGLPLVYGLYAALIPQIIYAFLGTSRQLAIGPTATDSLLVAAGISMFAQVETPEYIALAILLALMVGVIQFLFGIFRLGFLVNFLSRPVISGFTSAAAIIIGMSQVKDLLGIDIERSSKIQDLSYNVFMSVSNIGINWIALAIGLIGIVVIILIKRINKKYKLAIPAALVVVVLGILLVLSLHLDTLGVKIVGAVPDGLPLPMIPEITLDRLQLLFPVALTLALIAFMEAVSISKALQNKYKDYEIDNNQELIALGASNIVGSFFRSFPVTGGFGRSAVNAQAGARTGIAPIISALIIMLTLLVLTPLFYYLPKAILASIIMVAVFGLIDTKYPLVLWKVRKDELFMLLVTFVTTLTIGIREGILIGVILSLLMMIYETTQPHCAELGKLPHSPEYRNISRFQEVIVREDILILRYDASLYFANISHFKNTIEKAKERKGEKLHLIILNCESISSIDSSAMEVLLELINNFKKENIKFYLTNVKGPVRDTLHKVGSIQKIGEEHFFMNIQQAINFYDDKDNIYQEDSKYYALQSNLRF